MELHAFVLHLTRASGRRANAQTLKAECAATTGFDRVEIWPAVDGVAMSSSDLSEWVGADLFAPSYPFALRNGEIGCFLSHRQIWAEMQMRDADAALIIEDDAGVDPAQFAPALEMAAQHVTDLGYIQLQTRAAPGPAVVVNTNGPCRLTVPRLAGLRSTAQMISKQTAAHLLHLSEVIDRPVDTFVQSHWHTLLRPAMIHPSGVSDIANQLDGSTIQPAGKSALERLVREWHRGRYRRAVRALSRHSTAAETGGFGGGFNGGFGGG